MKNENDPFDKKIQFNPEIIDELTKAINDPPESVNVNITATGILALKLYFCRVLLMSSLNLSEVEADKYLLRAGVERELTRLSAVYSYFTQNTEKFDETTEL